MPQIERDYIATGKVKYVLRDFPLEGIHKDAFKAGEAAHCAGDQGKFWEMHARLFADQGALGPSDLVQRAQALGLDVPAFQRCLESGKYAARIRKDLVDGQRAGVSGTPTFFLGLSEPNNREVRVVRMIRGALPYASFKDAIDSLLSPPK